MNGEFEALEDFFAQVLEGLAPAGRVAVISFHSLEDRRVKHQFRRWAAEKRGRVIAKKPLVPGLEEIRDNPRSRSAKLRIFEKL